MPTGSFKDRGASVMLSLLRAAGHRRGAGGQLRQRRRRHRRLCRGRRHAGDDHDARLHQPRQDRADARARRRGGTGARHPPGHRRGGRRRAATLFYASHNWHPFFLHGTKTLAYELWEDLGFRPPTTSSCPAAPDPTCWAAASASPNCCAPARSTRLPRIFAAQPANCAPIAAAFQAGATTPVDVAITPTIAEGTAIAEADPADRGARHAARNRGRRRHAERSGDRRRRLRPGARSACTSSRPAPRSCRAFAKLLASGAITPDQRTVLVLTGSGLKATPRIADLLGQSTPPCMNLADLPTPCLVLDRPILLRNIARMAERAGRQGRAAAPAHEDREVDRRGASGAGRPARRHHRLHPGGSRVFRRPRHHRHPLRRRHHAAEARPGRQDQRRRRARRRHHRRRRDRIRHRRPSRRAARPDRGRHRRGARRRRPRRPGADRDRRHGSARISPAC